MKGRAFATYGATYKRAVEDLVEQIGNDKSLSDDEYMELLDVLAQVITDEITARREEVAAAGDQDPDEFDR